MPYDGRRNTGHVARALYRFPTIRRPPNDPPLLHNAHYHTTGRNASQVTRAAGSISASIGHHSVRGTMQYWLFKSEPDSFGIDRLERDGRTEWSGVRNYQARNFMKEMRKGDLGFFYHSSTKVPAIVGIVKVTKEAYPDFTARERGGHYFDPKATEANPIWEMVDVAFERRLPRGVTLAELRANPLLVPTMVLLRKGSRLSVQPVLKRDWDIVNAMALKPPAP
jgi:predicted RNA-binding protein with PUA-like domain